MQIQTEDYHIFYDQESFSVTFQGVLRLDGIEKYQPVIDLLLKAIEESSTLIINLRELEFLNSSGISMLSMFVVKVREKGNIQLTFQGSDQVLWQTKSLKNLQRLMPHLKLEYI